MSTKSEDNHDLQTYLDSFNKEIEDDNTLRTPEESESESITEKYFVDRVSDDYYYDTNDREDASSIAASDTNNATTSISGDQNTIDKIKREETEIDFLLILDNDSSKQQQENRETENKDKEIYDFDENEEEDPTIEEDDMVIVSKLVKVKSYGSSRDPKVVDYRCADCDYSTQKLYLLSRHLKTHSSERPFKCQVCERGFKSNASLHNHVNTHLGNKPHRCKFCEMSFTTSGELVRHTRYRHTHEKPHKCTECDYSSVELSKLRRHMRCHTGERPFQCPHCTYASPDSFKLKRHMRTHTGEKPYQCDICNARFTQSNSLKSHKLIHSVGDRPVFQCALCPTTCGRKTDLRLHMQNLHHSDQPIKCNRCSQELPDRYSYKVHIKTHDGEKCYRCQYCSYASISQRHLNSHLLVHTNKKPFVCSQCDSSFRQRQLLKRHINLYHDINYKPPEPREKLHSCPYCDRSFTHKGNLMRHLEVHDPETTPKTKEVKQQRNREVYFLDDDNENTNELTTEEEDYELLETYDDDIDQKSVKLIEEAEDVTDVVSEIRSVSSKKETVGKELMAVELGYDEQYMMVEVIQCEDDDDDDDDCNAGNDNATDDDAVDDYAGEDGTEDDEESGMQVQVQIDSSKTSLDNCYVFEDSIANRQFYEDTDAKLISIIDDN